MAGKLLIYDCTGRACTIDDQPVSLGSLAMLLYRAASRAANKEGASIARLAEFFFTSDQWETLHVTPEEFPEYPVDGLDRTENFGFICESWGPGIVEIFHRRGGFTHVGIQIGIRPALFRTQRRQQRCVKELVVAAKDAYGSPVSTKPVEGAGSAGLFFRDDRTVAFLGTAGPPMRHTTFRIWNREIWDPDLDAVLSVSQHC